MGWNDTTVVLIPKVKEQKSLKDLRVKNEAIQVLN
jgi:hypothetical protein